jgi:dTDP-4-dehydrorhamnose 3,5-epimerase
MQVKETALPGVLIIEPDLYSDDRGFFLETYQADKYAAAGIALPFVQDNHSYSARGTLRGVHAQYRKPQGKLVRALEGEVFDVVVDIARTSSTFGQWIGVTLSGLNHRQLYVPPGYGHGFCVLSESAHFLYKCTDVYDPGGELTLSWNDPTVGIVWPIEQPALSDKDTHGLSLDEFAQRVGEGKP